jgi:hypothetical protein
MATKMSYYIHFNLAFKTNGQEIESAVDRIQLELLDKNGMTLACTADTFMDTRLAARISGRGVGVEDDPAEMATLLMDSVASLSEIDKIVISVLRIN